MRTKIELDPIAKPVELPSLTGYRAVSTDVGANGDVIRMFAPEAIADSLFSTVRDIGGASFPKTHTDETYSATVVIEGAAGGTERKLPLLALTFPMVQTFPDGELLVVAPRCQRFTDGTYEFNARTYDSNGIVHEFCLGDGVQHVQIDRRGRIWVGYFDEGVFGNFGWGALGGSEPMGAAGLVCYDRSGRAVWSFKPPEGLDYIADCYALNVAADYVWACYYTGFPIVRIDSQGNVDAWQTDLRGPRKLAVSASSVLAFGGYGEKANDCVLLRLGRGHADIVADVALRLPDSVNLRKAQILGRGEILYVLADDALFTFAVPSE